MKWLIRFSLLLCVLLYGENSHLFAATGQNTIRAASGKAGVKQPVIYHRSTLQQGVLALFYAADFPNPENGSDYLSETEIEEEEETSSCRRQSDVDEYCITFFNARPPVCCYWYSNNRLPFSYHSFHNESCRFILYRAIRI
ncbi:hypothetical protein [Filimonas effusa]|uniref:Uncharacterized protein n=1 Tax=Filimonas effusa TaxID=2508721 RepID=A0A4Q1DAE5_9BACT|nr:hypothetical protein [Filimonas effusa]RXK86372.1 hypothetical protein ESB13_06085 [Filimonas effusa]